MSVKNHKKEGNLDLIRVASRIPHQTRSKTTKINVKKNIIIVSTLSYKQIDETID